ncbi:hypothetical protein BGZ59_004381, partial [Podila verticillata]
MGAQDNAPSVHSDNGTVVQMDEKHQHQQFQEQQSSSSSKIDTPTKEVLDDTASTKTSLDPGPSYPSQEVVTLPFKQLMVVFIGLMLGIFLSSLDQTIVS